MFGFSGVQSNGFVQPRGLADHDIVITTYETLCKELDYVNLPHNNSTEGRRFRNAKRYMALPSPLPCVQWWRVCLDEAQMVECTTTRTAEMALKLQAVHRWCVTGTPLQRSISDLYGLILFLNVDPYTDKHLWGGQVVCPYREGQRDTLHKVVCPLMWRTAKADVLDQIGIPGQSEELHWIHFSPVEEHFYRSQHVHCANVVLHRIALFDDLDTKLHSLSKDTMNSIVSPLLGLRQACCHPQAVKGQFISLNKSTMTMEELLKSLIKKARVECEESFRQVVSSLNAVERYREILMLIEQNKDKVKADRLQRVHTLHNLAELLEIHSDNLNIPRTTRDATLRQEAAELETTYLDKCIASLSSAKQAVEPLIQAVTDLQQQLTLDEAWWSLTMGQASVNKEDHEVVERVRQALMGGRKKYKNNSYSSLTGLESILTQDTDALESQRVKLLNDMEKLETIDPQTLVNEAVECHLRTIPNPEGKKEKAKKVCKLCKTSDLFATYEKLLFREEEAQIDTAVVENVRVFGKLNRNVWAEGEIQKILKAVLGYAKLKKLDETWIADGNVQLKIMDSEKKEFKHLRIFWRQLNDRVSALDELNMCKLQRSTAQSNLRRRMGQLQYLENLERDGLSKKGGANTELCPICRRTLEEKWSVLLCGHCFCMECLRQLGKHQHIRRQVCCPVCRECTALAEISYVNMNLAADVPKAALAFPEPPQPSEDQSMVPDAPQIRGRNSAKAEAVVQVLKTILAEDSNAKALVFSTDPIKNVTALLLPVHSGANGLNLIEATHVLLVEPILNPASELQALGRVHRIGQTRPTIIHRFVVRGTIEERMHEVLKAHHYCNTLEKDPVSLRDLYNMFSSTPSGSQEG
ncbi:hypothetical protein B566_EDAN002025 [Ephemera danica]|nr:hypothetical protein B566_EDAN002025 [Ephemera danica]